MGKTLFSDGNPLQSILGTIVNASFLNKIFSHRHDGLDQDGSAPLDYAAATGVANAYAIALAPALAAHITGLPIHFKATAANTGPSTLSVNLLAAVAIKQTDGSDLPAGAIVAGQIVTVVYNGASYMMVSGRGLATDAEVQAGTEGSKSITAKSLYNALAALATKAGFAILKSSPGYIKFPSWLGGLIFQWGVSTPTSGGQITISFPIAFPAGAVAAVGSILGGNNTYNLSIISATQITISAFQGATGAALNGQGVYWFVVGY